MRRLSYAVLAIVVLFSICAMAQNVATANLRGTVTDANGAAVPNAKVTATLAAQNLERTTTSDAQGHYQFVQLPPGTYTVTVDAGGFTKFKTDNVRLTVGQDADLRVPLAVAGANIEVTVEAQPQLVETQTSSQSTTVDRQRIEDLPINGRNYINFTLTNSQTARDTAPSIGAAPTSGINIGGQRARSNLVNVDGVNNVDNSTNGVRSTVSQDAVQEFQILTNGYMAEYGDASGGVINIITRSGTNNFHGTAFAYLRNRYIQATNPFSTVEQPAYTRVQPGFTIGGPIKTDKTFFFFSYETTRRHESGFTSIGLDNFGLAPFDASKFLGLPAGAVTFQGTPQQIAFLNSIPNALLGNPAVANAVGQYVALVGGSSGTAVTGNLPAALKGPLPANRFITTNALLPASFHPLNTVGGNYPIFEGTSLWGLRFDHKFNDHQTGLLRVNVSPSTVTGIQVNAQNQNFGQNAFSRTSEQTYRDAAVTAQHTWLIGNTHVNEARFQYARRGLRYNFSSAPGGGDVAINIPGTAFFGREPFSFVNRTEERYELQDNFTWTHGTHTIKFGGDYNHIPLSADFTVNFGGIYNFGQVSATSLSAGFGQIPGLNFPAFSAVQSYGLGIPQVFIQGIGNPHDSFTNNTLGVFGQDQWRITPNFTLNYGVRYDVEYTPTFAASNAISQAAQDALGITQGIPRDYNNVAPRVGFAWDPWKNGKTVVRGSYGLFYDHPLLALAFDSDVADQTQAPQVVFFGGSPCNPASPSTQGPLSLNATNLFQGIQTSAACALPPALAAGLQYLPQEQRFAALNVNSVFTNDNFLTAGLPLVNLPFGFPVAKNFEYAYSDQASLGVEHEFGNDFSLGIAYNFNGGHHLNRPINVNAVQGQDLVTNFNRAVTYSTQVRNALIAAGNPAAAAQIPIPTDPRFVTTCPALLPTIPGLVAPNFVPAAAISFFRPSGLNPTLAPAIPQCASAFNSALTEFHLGLGVPIPFSDPTANFSNGSSVYHGLTLNLKKRFSKHYEFLASYTYSHAIDDSTDLQSLLAPQDNYNPSAERSNSTFDQRHRFVFSGSYQTGELGNSVVEKIFSHFTVAPIIEVSSGRPFTILTGTDRNFDFGANTDRPVTPTAGGVNSCGDAIVASKYSPTGFFAPACFLDGTLVGNLPRNSAVKPYTLFNDLRIGRYFKFNERVRMDGTVDIFNIANKFNVADVNPLYTNAGQPTSSFDPRQFQFGLKLSF